MENFYRKYFDIIYFTINFVAIGLTLVYGQILEANIGEFGPFMVFGAPLPLWAIIIIPIFITMIYAFTIFIAYRNNLLDLSKKGICFISILLVMLIYMLLLVALKDNSYLYSSEFQNANIPSINDRVYSIFAFYLELLMIYAFYALYKRTEHLKLFIEIILILVGIYALVSIIYSLSAEYDKYVYLVNNFTWFDKEYGDDKLIKSFYGIGNVFGHTVYCGALAMIFLALVTKKYYVGFLSIVFIPFIFLSKSRAGTLSIIVFFAVFMVLMTYICFKKSLSIGISYLSIILIVLLILILEAYVFKTIEFEYEGNTYYLKDALYIYFKGLDADRFSILETVFKNATVSDYLFGLGYGISLIPPRTYGFIYYMHNTFAEYIAIGGVVYVVFIGMFFVTSFYKAVSIFKKNPIVLILLTSLVFSQIFYELSESIPVLSANFFGAVFGLYFFIIPNLEYSEAKEELYVIRPFYFLPKKFSKLE